jgi:hypothetical protein
MTTAPDLGPGAPSAAPEHLPPGRVHRGVAWDRVVVGLLIAGVGVATLLQGIGVTVPWNLLPAAAVVLVGVVLLVGLAGGRGRDGVAVVGLLLLVVAVGVGVRAERFAGPLGDRTVVPGPADWADGATRVSAGTVTVDLTGVAPPAAGRMRVELGAGRVVVRLPDDPVVRVEAGVVAGTVAVDGATVQQGVELRWTDPAGPPSGPLLVVDVGAGDVEVRHDGS